jgi:hypothetical protein
MADLRLDVDELRLLIADMFEVESLLLSSLPPGGPIPGDTANALHKRSVLRLKLKREVTRLTRADAHEREVIKASADAAIQSDDIHPGGLQDARRTRRAVKKLEQGLFKETK